VSGKKRDCSFLWTSFVISAKNPPGNPFYYKIRNLTYITNVIVSYEKEFLIRSCAKIQPIYFKS